MTTDPRPLIAHVVYRFDTGGLENGVVNLVNRLPAERFRHVVIALTEITSFSRRIERDNVELIAMHKPPGQGLWMFAQMRRLFRRLRPDVVHTRNLAALEMTVPAAWAGVPIRVHGEHGWDERDPDGRNRKFRLIRRAYRPFVHRYVALSRHLERYVVDHAGVAPHSVTQIYNGVDTLRFAPRVGSRPRVAGSPFTDPNLWLVGTLGRLQAVKNQVLLAQAFSCAIARSPPARQRMRLLIAGDGPLRPAVEQALRDGGVADLAWMAGERGDAPDLLRGIDAFVLPSRAEGISNTILEAMATALPIIATDVGGNAELLDETRTGRLVGSGDVEAMARVMLDDFDHPHIARGRGQAARVEVESRFSLDQMVNSYRDLYDGLLAERRGRVALKHRFT